MDELWFEDELAPDPEAVDRMGEGAKGPIAALREQIQKIRGYIRIHNPRVRVEDQKLVKTLPFVKPGYRYVTVYLECEFDPGPQAAAVKAGFVSAEMRVFIRSEKRPYPAVYQVIPENIDLDLTRDAKVKIEPTVKLPGDFGIGIGSIETDLRLGRIAPITRGFKGNEEMEPYWTLEHHRKAPLYGIRNFRMTIETPPAIDRFYLIARAEGWLRTSLGPVEVKPKVMIPENRLRFLVDLAAL